MIFLSAVLLTFVAFVAGQYQVAALALIAPWQLTPASVNLGAAGAELLTRYFHGEIQPLLFPGNTFINRALNDDAFVNNNSVELPHSGTIPAVAVDRSSLPATIAKRTDAATNYLLEELTTDPTLLQDSESYIVNYDKRASILQQHALQINTKAADRALYKWAASASGVRKVNSSGGTRVASGPSQTGNRNKFVKADIIKVRQIFFADDVINENADLMGVAVMTPAQYGDLLELTDLTEAQKYGRATFPSGVIDRVLGFDIYVRSRVVVFDGSQVIKAEGAAAAATDQDTAVFYHPSFVRRAKGAVKVYVNPDKAEYYGTIFSTMVRFGALAARNDGKGIVTLTEWDGA